MKPSKNIDTQEQFQYKKYHIPDKLVRSQTNIAVIYNSSKIQNKQQPEDIWKQINGYARILFTNGTILEGDFKQGQSKESKLFGNYLQGWVFGPWRFGEQIYGIVEQYDSKNQFVYGGEFKNCSRNGNGKQQILGGYSEGEWKNGKKHGKFKQLFRERTITGEGKYQHGRKVGSWKFSDSKQFQTVDYGDFPEIKQKDLNEQKKYTQYSGSDQNLKTKNQSNGSKNVSNLQNKQKPHQKIKVLSFQYLQTDSQKQKNKITNFTSKQIQHFLKTPNHNMMMTQSSYQKLKDPFKMLDDSTLSAWAVLMQYLLAQTHNDNIIVYALDLFKYYTGIYFKDRKYKSVQNYTKHFSSNFSIFTLVEQKPRTLLFPIIKYAHFSLATVVISKIKDQFKFECKIYDSLRGSRSYSSIYPKYDIRKYDQIWQAVHNYLIDQLQKRVCEQESKNKIKRGIQTMDLTYQQCPTQLDGVSCGVFVALFMHYFCLGKQDKIPPCISRDYISQYRKFMERHLKSSVIEFEALKVFQIKEEINGRYNGRYLN